MQQVSERSRTPEVAHEKSSENRGGGAALDEKVTAAAGSKIQGSTGKACSPKISPQRVKMGEIGISKERLKELTEAKTARDYYNENQPCMWGDGVEYDVASMRGTHKDPCWDIFPTPDELVELQKRFPQTWG